MARRLAMLIKALSVCACRKLAGFAEFAQICSTTPTRNRDKNGNLLSEVAARYRKDYVYNAQNRMIFSDVQDAFLNTRNLTEYAYDAFGRRIETIEYLGDSTRNLYDGFSFDVVGKTLLQTRSAPAMTEQKYRAGSAGHPELGSGSASAGRSGAGVANGTRYRYIGDEPLEQAGSAGAGNNGANASSSANGAKTRSRPNAEYVLYSNGEPVAMSADGDTSYFGTDILGSVRSVTDKYGNVKASYEYDAFGTPYLSNLDSGMSFGYTGKIFDSATGLYDYGFRDYSPNSARFTTVDPVRDGSNWFSYVVNDPVNYIDPFGLTSTDVNKTEGQYTQDHVNKTYTFDIKDEKAFDSVASIMMDMQNEGYTATAVTAGNKTQTFTQYSQMLNYYNDNFKTTNSINYSVAAINEEPFIQRNQIKSSKTAYLDFSSQSSSSGEAFNIAVGAATVSSEYIGNKYLVATGEGNFLTYGLGYSNTENKIGGGTTLNFASITGTIGLKNLGKNNDKGITLSGGLGISLGAEIYKTNNSFAIDLSPLFINLRVEYTWAR